MGILANSECCISSGSALLTKIKTAFREINPSLETSTYDPLKYKNGQSHTYCINMYGKIYQNTKGKYDHKINSILKETYLF